MRRSLHAFLVGLLTLSFSVDTAKACWYLRQGRAACVVRPACPPPVLRHAPGPVRVIVIQPAGCAGPAEFGNAVYGFAYEEIPCGQPIACCGDAGTPVADAVGESAVIAVPTPAPEAARSDVVREMPRSLPAIAQPEPPISLPLTVAPTPVQTPVPTPVPAPVPELQPVSPAANVEPVAPGQPPVAVTPVEVKPVAPAEVPAPPAEKKPEPPVINPSADPLADPAPAEKPAAEKAPLPAKDPVPPADPVAEKEPAPAPQPPVPEEKAPAPEPELPAELEENLFDAQPGGKKAKPQADAANGEPAPDEHPEPEPRDEPAADEKPAAQPAAKEPAEEPKAAPDKDPAAETTGEQAGENEKAKPATKEEPAREEPAVDPFGAVEPLRRWIDDTGRHAVVGRFMAAGVDGVELLTPDGRTLVVPLQRLSAVDRSYASEAAARQVAAQRPLPAPRSTAGL